MPITSEVIPAEHLETQPPGSSTPKPLGSEQQRETHHGGIWALNCLELRRRGERPSPNGGKHLGQAIMLRYGNLRNPNATRGNRMVNSTT